MNPLKKLAGQTAVYGLSTILGRAINYALVPFYTYLFHAPADFGTNTEFFAYISFLNVIFTYGMETALFNFSSSEPDKQKVYHTALVSLVVSTAVLVLPFLLFSGPISGLLRYPGHSDFIIWCILIVGTDAVAAIPFARLREQNKAKRFAAIKLVNIFVNVLLNLFFIGWCKSEYEHATGSFWAGLYNPVIGIGYAFVANLVANVVSLLLLLPDMRAAKYDFDRELWKRMMRYALPLLVVGLAGMVNETLDRVLIKYMLAEDIAMTQVGIYGACYKISILMTIFRMAFQYAAEPFFFAQKKDGDNKKVYARVMKYFVIACSVIFLGTMTNMSWIQYLVSAEYRSGLGVVPILLLANLALGIYFNLSIWYKLTNRTLFGAWLTLAGAVLTIGLNLLWIPRIGYMGSAWATLICYASMAVASYYFGQKYFPVKYSLRRILTYLGLSIVLYLLSTLIHTGMFWPDLLLKNLLLLPYLWLLWKVEGPALRKK